MTEIDTPIAELNIGQLLHPSDDPRSAEFTDNSDRVNAIAERSAGFIWRCVDEAATLRAEGISLYDGDPNAICTMSVWESRADLADFVLRTVHGSFLRRRATWFKPQDHRTRCYLAAALGSCSDLSRRVGQAGASKRAWRNG